MSYEVFYDEIKHMGNGQSFVTIPSKLVEFAGLQKGDKVRVLIQKKVELDD